MKTRIKIFSISVLVLLLVNVSALAQKNAAEERISVSYDKKTRTSTVVLNPIELPGSEGLYEDDLKDNFRVGAMFEFAGKAPKKEPCCIVIVVTSIGKKKFLFEKIKEAKISADLEEFTSADVFRREANWATAFALAQIAFPEEIFIGMKTAEFKKIANAGKVSVRLDAFTIELSADHLKGFREMVEKMKPEEKNERAG